MTAKTSRTPAADDTLSLRLTRDFDAPRALVFSMWARPEHMNRWSVPNGFTIPEAQMDFRPNGLWFCHMCAPDGTDHKVQGTYREIVTGERIVMTHAWLDEMGVPGPETMVTVTFADRGGGTRIVLHQTGFASAASRDGHQAGWSECLDKLRDMLATVSKQ